MRAPPRSSPAVRRLALTPSSRWLPLCCAALLSAPGWAQPAPADAAAPDASAAPLHAPAWPGGATGVETARTDWRAAHRQVSASAGQDHSTHPVPAPPAAPPAHAHHHHGQGHEHGHDRDPAREARP